MLTSAQRPATDKLRRTEGCVFKIFSLSFLSYLPKVKFNGTLFTVIRPWHLVISQDIIFRSSFLGEHSKKITLTKCLLRLTLDSTLPPKFFTLWEIRFFPSPGYLAEVCSHTAEEVSTQHISTKEIFHLTGSATCSFQNQRGSSCKGIEMWRQTSMPPANFLGIEIQWTEHDRVWKRMSWFETD